jgi:hypothetical protein
MTEAKRIEARRLHAISRHSVEKSRKEQDCREKRLCPGAALTKQLGRTETLNDQQNK